MKTLVLDLGRVETSAVFNASKVSICHLLLNHVLALQLLYTQLTGLH